MHHDINNSWQHGSKLHHGKHHLGDCRTAAETRATYFRCMCQCTKTLVLITHPVHVINSHACCTACQYRLILQRNFFGQSIYKPSSSRLTHLARAHGPRCPSSCLASLMKPDYPSSGMCTWPTWPNPTFWSVPQRAKLAHLSARGPNPNFRAASTSEAPLESSSCLDGSLLFGQLQPSAEPRPGPPPRLAALADSSRSSNKLKTTSQPAKASKDCSMLPARAKHTSRVLSLTSRVRSLTSMRQRRVRQR